MQLREVLRKVWQFISFLFVLYGFYLLFLFILDTMIRVNKGIALPFAIVATLALMAVSGFFWIRKHLRGSSPSVS